MGFNDPHRERREIVENLMSSNSPIERAKWKKELELHDLIDEEIRYGKYGDRFDPELNNSILSAVEEKQKIDEIRELKNGSNFQSPNCDIGQKQYRNIDQVHKDMEKVFKEIRKAQFRGDYDKVKEYYGCIKNLENKVTDIIDS